MFTVLTETAGWLAVAPEVWAQPQPGDIGPIIDRATGWLVGILAAVATLFLTLGGVRYVLAGGDPQQVEGAKKSLRNAVVGYAFAALAPLLLAIVGMILGV
jgi:hypothetical protein